jgi:hypothetical protein
MEFKTSLIQRYIFKSYTKCESRESEKRQDAPGYYSSTPTPGNGYKTDIRCVAVYHWNPSGLYPPTSETVNQTWMEKQKVEEISLTLF